MSRNNTLAAAIGKLLLKETKTPQHCQVQSFSAKLRPKSIAKAKPILRSITADARSRTSNALLPVGIFIDLDNVAPKTLRRNDAEQFVKPLTHFAHSVGKLDTLYAFGNRATQTYKSQKELDYRLIDQQYVPAHEENHKHNHLDDNYENDVSTIRSSPVKSVVQSGYDTDGLLRCGICGAKMKLSKKDIGKGVTMEGKLEKHMKNLHDNEQKKRNNKATNKKGKRRFTEKERIKYHKYKAAQIGVPRGKRMLVPPPISSQSSPSNYNKYNNKGKTNDLFAILQEKGVKTFSAKNVDEVLTKSAYKWIHTINKRTNERTNDPTKPTTENLYSKGCLLLYSNDSDFSALLKYAKADGYITVAVTNNENEQATRLKKSCDIILKQSLAPPPLSSSLFGTSETNDNDSNWDTVDKDAVVQDDNLSPSSSSLFVAEPVTNDGLLFLKEYKIRKSSFFGVPGNEEQ